MFGLFSKLVVKNPTDVNVFNPQRVNVFKEKRLKHDPKEVKYKSLGILASDYERLSKIPLPSTYRVNATRTGGTARIRFLLDLYFDNAKLGKGNHKLRKFTVKTFGPEEVTLGNADEILNAEPVMKN